MKTTKTLALFSATLGLVLAGSAFAEDARSAQYADTVPAVPSTVSRAEVEADRNLWLKSGLASYDGSQSADATVPGYTDSVKAYRAARNGPAYMVELRRVQGVEATRLASGPAPAAKSE
jgi:hypothetical protein